MPDEPVALLPDAIFDLDDKGRLIPAPSASALDILYGSRTTSLTYRILNHDRQTGVDSLAGRLDGVQSGQSQWTLNTAVKGSNSLAVEDLAVAAKGKLRLTDVNLIRQRIQPIRHIKGLPDQPLGVFVPTESPAQYSGTGKIVNLKTHDKTTRLLQDQITETTVADPSKTVLEWVKLFVASAGETINLIPTDDRLAGPKIWMPGGSDSEPANKLSIVNDLLDVIGYDHLGIDGAGNLRTGPYVKPANRPLRYEVLGVTRQLIDGARSIYAPEFTVDQDILGPPNRVIAPENISDEGVDPLIGIAENWDENSRLSFPNRDYWKTETMEAVEVAAGTIQQRQERLDAAAMRSLIARSSPPGTIQITCLPIPIWIGDIIWFTSLRAKIGGLFQVTSITDNYGAFGLMQLNLQEVMDL